MSPVTAIRDGLLSALEDGDPTLAGALAGTFRAVVIEIRRKLAAGEEIAAVRAEVATAAGVVFGALDAATSPR